MNVKVELSPERFGLGLVQNLTAIAEGHANEKCVGGINKGDKCKYSSDPDANAKSFSQRSHAWNWLDKFARFSLLENRRISNRWLLLSFRLLVIFSVNYCCRSFSI